MDSSNSLKRSDTLSTSVSSYIVTISNSLVIVIAHTIDRTNLKQALSCTYCFEVEFENVNENINEHQQQVLEKRRHRRKRGDQSIGVERTLFSNGLPEILQIEVLSMDLTETASVSQSLWLPNRRDEAAQATHDRCSI